MHTPYTNLDWRNYEFSATIIKPAGSVYDSAGVGVIFYAKDQNNYYSLKVRGMANNNGIAANRFIITRYSNGVEDSIGHIDSLFEGSKDTMRFDVKVITSNYQDSIKDGEVAIQCMVWGASSNQPGYPGPIYDVAPNRKTDGFCGVQMNYNSTSLLNVNSNTGIRIKDTKVQKVEE